MTENELFGNSEQLDNISRAAVVDAIEGVDWYHINKNGEMVHGANDNDHQAWYKAEDIYKAVGSVPSAQPVAKDINVPAKDCISRAQAIEAIKEDKIDLTDPNVVAVFKATGDFEKVETQVMTCDRHIKILKGLPSAQQERKKGQWIYHPEIGWGDTWLCDQCGEKTTSTVMGKPRANYCPMCGADMRGKQDE